MGVKAKRLEFSIALDRDGRAAAEDGSSIAVPAGWTAEHLVLAGLARCTLTSLRYHAGRAGLEASGAATASGVVTRREEDGRYALVEIDCRLDVGIDPPPAGEDLAALLAKAERDCFVGASLRATPRYAWRVNGSAA